jgi:WD40 repeat protein
VRLSLDGRTAWTAIRGGGSRLWQVATGEPAGPVVVQPVAEWSRVVGPDGVSPAVTHQAPAAAPEEQVFRLLDLSTGRPLGEPLIPVSRSSSALTRGRFSPDGRRWVAWGLPDHTVRLWDAATGAPRGSPLPHPRQVVSALFTPDGRVLMTASNDGGIRLWDAGTGRSLGEPLAHPDAFPHLAFSPDGQRALTGGAGNTTRLWDVATHRPLTPPWSSDLPVDDVTFSPDGGRVVATTRAITRPGNAGEAAPRVRVWDVPPPLTGAPERVALWARVLTGMELGTDGTPRPLDDAAWDECRRLAAADGPPAPWRRPPGPRKR